MYLWINEVLDDQNSLKRPNSSLFSLNKVAIKIFFLRIHMCGDVPQKKVNNFSFLAGKLPTPSFVLKKVFIFWSKIYKLPSGRHSDGLFTQRKYSGEKFMTACQSDPWSSPGSCTSRMRKAPPCCWVMEAAEEVSQMAISLQPATSSPTLHCCLLTTSKAKTFFKNAWELNSL